MLVHRRVTPSIISHYESKVCCPRTQRNAPARARTQTAPSHEIKLNCSVIIFLAGHDGSVTSVNFSHDSRWLLTSSCDRTVRLWSPAHSDPLMTFTCVNHNFASELGSSTQGKVSEKQRRAVFAGNSGRIVLNIFLCIVDHQKMHNSEEKSKTSCVMLKTC